MIMLGWQTQDNSNIFFMLKDHAANAIAVYHLSLLQKHDVVQGNGADAQHSIPRNNHTHSSTGDKHGTNMNTLPF